MNISSNYTREQKEKIFEIKKYSFLKRKRKEIVDHYRKSHPWTNEEDDQLKELLYSFTSLSWKFISNKLKERSPSQCMNHWNMNLNPGIKKGKWSKEEDELLLSYVKENGTNWGELQLYLQGRTTKQIRERWVNYLSKDTSDFRWNRDMDKKLIELYVLFGSSWVKISSKIPQTTENMVKNRFYSLLRACVSKCKKNNKGVNDKIRRIKKELDINYNNNNKRESDVKLCDFSLDDNDVNKNNKGKDIIDKLINNPYLSKKKNYSLKILIEFLPFLIEDLDIDLETLNNPMKTMNQINEEHNLNGEDKDNDYKENYIDIFNTNDHNNEDLTDLFNINNSNAFEMDIDNNDSNSIHSSNTNPSILTKQISSLTKVFENHDYQIMHLFFESFRNKALLFQ